MSKDAPIDLTCDEQLELCNKLADQYNQADKEYKMALDTHDHWLDHPSQDPTQVAYTFTPVNTPVGTVKRKLSLESGNQPRIPSIGGRGVSKKPKLEIDLTSDELEAQIQLEKRKMEDALTDVKALSIEEQYEDHDHGTVSRFVNKNDISRVAIITINFAENWQQERETLAKLLPHLLNHGQKIGRGVYQPKYILAGYEYGKGPWSARNNSRYINRGIQATHHVHILLYSNTQSKVWHKVKAIWPRCHVGKQYGTLFDTVDYLKKYGDFTEYGKKPYSQEEKGKEGWKGGKGEIDRWSLIIETLKTQGLTGVLMKFPSESIRYWGQLQQIERHVAVRPPDLTNDQMICIPTGKIEEIEYRESPDSIPIIKEEPVEKYVCGWWIHGVTGTGKSRLVRDRVPADCLYGKMQNKWWDHFDPRRNTAVLIEDVDPDTCNGMAELFKVWLDRYAFTCEVKGTVRFIRPLLIIITSQYTISECFRRSVDAEAIERRCLVSNITQLTA